MSDLIKNDIRTRMDSSISSLKTEMSGIRAGRASPSMLDTIKVDVYGSKMPINQIGNITTPEPRLINIEIWDQGNVNAVEKAIRESDLGINPSIEGTLIRLPLPQLTEERKLEYIKLAKKIGEASKVAIRNIRRDGIEQFKKLEKDKEIGEDDSKKLQSDIEEITSTHVKLIDSIVSEKEVDLSKV
ncbi:ribosome recycling factor [Pelagibacterales bacterium]|jgi:ribosome recycling factor|nr:ribosome recycling factor [Pelagibacterales bacterium]|tara:strand:+ start:67 stop:624 length:558 start_codon:yes stop_codon:yes gene_type:complete